MTVHQALHKLWTYNETSLDRDDNKRLWMLLEKFVEEKGGLRADAAQFDVRGGNKPLDEIARPKPREAKKIRDVVRKAVKALKRPIIG